MSLDIRTLVLINLVTNLVNAGAIAIIWRQNRGRFKGVALWLVGMLIQAAGAGLILPRGDLPDVLTVMLPNLLLISGAIILFKGLEQFSGCENRGGFNLVVMVAFLALIYYNTAVQPDVFLRIIWFSLSAALIYGRMGWLLLYRVKPSLHRVTRYTGWTMVGYTLVTLARITLMLLFPMDTNDLFKSGVVDGWIMTAFFILGVCFTISLIIMVNTLLVEEARFQEEKFNKSFHSSPFAILLITLADGKIHEVNDGFVKLTGYTIEESLGKTTFDLDLWVREEDRREVIRSTLRNRRIQGREIQIRKKSGELMTGLLSIDIIIINQQKYVLATIGDISELSQMKERLQTLATHDALTGLPNRTLLYDRAEIALASARRNLKMLTVMSLDLDKFKIINDTLGHDVGDRVLVEVARRLTDSLRHIDTVARFGGDEFIVLLVEINHPTDSVEVAERIVESLRRPFYHEGNPLSLSISIGIAHYPDHGSHIEDLLKRSDKALYQVKEEGGDNYLLAG